jgi:hypothetical protein
LNVLFTPCPLGKLFSTIRKHPPLICRHKTFCCMASHLLLMYKLFLPLPAHLRKTVFQELKCASKSSLSPLSSSSPFRPSPSCTHQAIRSDISYSRPFSSTRKMSDLSIELTAPNGRKYTQPTGLFINNEWVKSSDGKKITSINPT